jgi:hypothetical protein
MKPPRRGELVSIGVAAPGICLKIVKVSSPGITEKVGRVLLRLVACYPILSSL